MRPLLRDDMATPATDDLPAPTDGGGASPASVNEVVEGATAEEAVAEVHRRFGAGARRRVQKGGPWRAQERGRSSRTGRQQWE